MSDKIKEIEKKLNKLAREIGKLQGKEVFIGALSTLMRSYDRTKLLLELYYNGKFTEEELLELLLKEYKIETFGD